MQTQRVGTTTARTERAAQLTNELRAWDDIFPATNRTSITITRPTTQPGSEGERERVGSGLPAFVEPPCACRGELMVYGHLVSHTRNVCHFGFEDHTTRPWRRRKFRKSGQDYEGRVR